MTDIRKDLETAAVAMADFEGGSIFRETLLNALAALDAIELAYGLLWRCAVDRRTADGRRIYLARKCSPKLRKKCFIGHQKVVRASSRRAR